VYKVLIVDDEILVRLALKNSINWNKYGMTVIADVQNGHAAWEIYKKEKPDLIITDIKMPIIDGMELIKKIREKDKETVVIILSCLEDFELLRQAVSLNISGYILKLTMSNEEIENVLSKAQDELKGIHEGKPTLTLDNNLIKEKMIKELIFYNNCSINEFNQSVIGLKLRIKPNNLLMCLIEIDHFEQVRKGYSYENGQVLSQSILNILDEISNQYERIEALRVDDSHYILLFSFHDISSEQSIQEELYTILGHIKKVLKTYFNSTATFGISGLRNGFASLKDLYTECLDILKQKFYLGLDTYITNSSKSFVRKAYENNKESLKEICGGVYMFNELIRNGINSRIESFIQSEDISSKEQVQNLFVEWIYWLYVSLNLNGEDIDVLLGSCLEQLHYSETFEEMIEVFKEYIDGVNNIAGKKKALSREVAKATRFIKVHYPEDITLQQVAEHVNLSPNYLSGLLKREIGLSFVEYLNYIRITKAKELLSNTDLKSYEIAEKVGFTDDSYFSRSFMKQTGIRPNKFRRQSMQVLGE